jgi:hypothetical protein
MNTETNTVSRELDQNQQVAIDQTDLERIAAALPVRSGLHAGRKLAPCL